MWILVRKERWTACRDGLLHFEWHRLEGTRPVVYEVWPYPDAFAERIGGRLLTTRYSNLWMKDPQFGE